MKKSEIMVGKVKRLTGTNMKAFSILLAVYDKGREDVLDRIFEAIRHDEKAITPESIVSVYKNQCNEDLNTFIKLFDKTKKEAKKIRSMYYNEYERDIDKLQREFTTGIKED